MPTINESMTWHPASTPPDADQTVLLWVQYQDGEADWTAGWMDADGWRLCESGGLCSGTVWYWADVGGPAQ